MRQKGWGIATRGHRDKGALRQGGMETGAGIETRWGERESGGRGFETTGHRDRGYLDKGAPKQGASRQGGVGVSRHGGHRNLGIETRGHRNRERGIETKGKPTLVGIAAALGSPLLEVPLEKKTWGVFKCVAEDMLQKKNNSVLQVAFGKVVGVDGGGGGSTGLWIRASILDGSIQLKSGIERHHEASIPKS